MGNSRTLTPVAWQTAAVMAEATAAMEISPQPRAPYEFAFMFGVVEEGDIDLGAISVGADDVVREVRI